MNKPDYDIKEEFCNELNEISYICNNLKSGKIKEFTGNKADGLLSTNIIEIEKKYDYILSCIQKGCGSTLSQSLKHSMKVFSNTENNNVTEKTTK